MSEIDISYWSQKKIADIAEQLHRRIAINNGWNWKVEFNQDPDDESISTSYWTITGEAKRHRLSIKMYLGRVPWTTRWKLYFTKDGKDYMCLEEMFSKVPALKELEIKLDQIGREIKKRQDKKVTNKKRNEDRQYESEQRQEADELLTSLRR